MRIAILAAMDKELRLILGLMGNHTTENTDGLEYHRGKIGVHEIVAAKCGIGKVNSAVNTLRLIDGTKPDLVINSGVAGGADPSMKIGSLLVADSVSYHDVWCGPGTEYGTADGMPRFMHPSSEILSLAQRTLDDTVRYGQICSGDKFISQASEVEEIKGHFPEALAVDMESASIAQVCCMKGIPFNIVRVMSDTPGSGENISQYQNFWADAPVKTFEAVKTLIENL